MSKGTVNKCIILGRLGQDPELRSTASGSAVANFNIATTEVGKADANGQRQELTEWHKVVLFGKTAEIAGQYLQKGSQVYIEGRLQTRKWQDQNGQDRYSTEIVGNEMQFIGGKSDNAQQGGFAQPQQGPQQQPTHQGGFNRPPSGQSAPPPNGFGGNEIDDGIPF